MCVRLWVRTRPMRALPLMLGAVCVAAIAYRYYSAFIAAKVLCLDDSAGHAGAPAQRRAQLRPDQPAGCCSAITSRPSPGAGPLIGPVAGGAVRLSARLPVDPVRRGARRRRARLRHPDGLACAATAGRSPRSRARSSGRRSGSIAGVAILFIVIIALAAWATSWSTRWPRARGACSPSASPIPIALLMGLWMYRVRAGKIGEATVIGVVLLLVLRGGRQVGGRVELGACVPAQRAHAHARHRGLRLRRQRAAGVDAALPARLPLDLHEDRHHRALDRRHRDRESRAQEARRQPVRRRRARSSRARSFRSCSSPSPAARSAAFTRWSPAAPRPR